MKQKQTRTNVLQGYSLTEPEVLDLAEVQTRFGSGEQKDLRLLTLISTSLCLSSLAFSSSVDRLPLICNPWGRTRLSHEFLVGVFHRDPATPRG